MKCKSGRLCFVRAPKTTNVIINSITNTCTCPLEPALTFMHLHQPVLCFRISKLLFTENASCIVVFFFCSVTISFMCIVSTLLPFSLLFECFVTLSLRALRLLEEDVSFHRNKQFCLARRNVEVSLCLLLYWQPHYCLVEVLYLFSWNLIFEYFSKIYREN